MYLYYVMGDLVTHYIIIIASCKPSIIDIKQRIMQYTPIMYVTYYDATLLRTKEAVNHATKHSEFRQQSQSQEQPTGRLAMWSNTCTAK